MRPQVVRLLIAGAAVIAAVALLTRQHDGPGVEVGGLYSVQDEDNEFGGPTTFGVAKVLAVDEAVHVRVYKQRFKERPTAVDPKQLTVGDESDRDRGIGHMPLSRTAFASWNPILIQRSVVSETELAGYREWAKNDHGVWK